MTEQPKYHCRRCARRNIEGMLATVDYHHKRKDRFLIVGAGLALLTIAALIGAGVWAVGQVFG